MSGFPPYLQTDNQAVNYGLTNQLSPEAALQEQALNRRRAIANLLVQQGLTQGPGGKMVGRFYVADSPVQGFANLARTGVGAYISKKADDEQRDIAQRDQQSVIDAIRAHQDKMKQLAALQQNPIGVTEAPQAAPEPAPQGGAPVSPPMADASAQPEPFRGIAPRPDGPYQGQVGAVPMPDAGVQSAAPPIPAPVRDPIAGQEMMRGLDLNNSQPADMSQFAPPAAPVTQAPPSAVPPAPAPIPPPARLQPQPPRQETLEDLADLLTSQHPTVRQYGMLRAQQLQKQAEMQAAAQRFAQEQALQRYQHDTPSGSAIIGRDTQQAIANQRHEDSVAQLLQNQRADQQALELRRDQFNSQDAYNKAKLDLDKQQAAQRLKLDRDELNLKGQQLALGKVPPGYRATKDGNLEAIPGGPADTKLQGVLNQDTAMLQNSNAGFDRLASTVNQLMNHPGLEGITGLRGKVPDVPGTDAANARALLNTLKSQISFDVLQEMRNNSKTGGALGAVSDAEGKRLENNLAALDTTQGTQHFKNQLKGILDYAEGAKSRLRDAFNMKHKAGEPMPMTPSSKGPAVGTIDGGYRFKGGDPSKPESWEKVQ